MTSEMIRVLKMGDREIHDPNAIDSILDGMRKQRSIEETAEEILGVGTIEKDLVQINGQAGELITYYGDQPEKRLVSKLFVTPDIRLHYKDKTETQSSGAEHVVFFLDTKTECVIQVGVDLVTWTRTASLPDAEKNAFLQELKSFALEEIGRQHRSS